MTVNSPVISLHYSAIRWPLFSPTALELRFSSGMHGWPLILLLILYSQAYKNKDKLFSFLPQNGFVLLYRYFIKNPKICQLLRSPNKKPWWMPFFKNLIFHLCHINILHLEPNLCQWRVPPVSLKKGKPLKLWGDNDGLKLGTTSIWHVHHFLQKIKVLRVLQDESKQNVHACIL